LKKNFKNSQIQISTPPKSNQLLHVPKLTLTHSNKKLYYRKQNCAML